MSALVKLQNLLDRVPPGPIDNVTSLSPALTAAWDDIEGTGVHSTSADKLVGRIEQVEWNPPVLSFRLERHGRTVNGSKRADLHRWDVDVRRGVATCTTGKLRQKHPNDKQYNKKQAMSDAKKVLAAIKARRDHPWLRWAKDRSAVAVMVGKFVRADNNQTLTGRRRRFRGVLEALLDQHGWEADGPRYVPKSQASAGASPTGDVPRP